MTAVRIYLHFMRVIIFYLARGGSAGGDHTLLGFFQCSKPSCLCLGLGLALKQTYH